MDLFFSGPNLPIAPIICRVNRNKTMRMGAIYPSCPLPQESRVYPDTRVRTRRTQYARGNNREAISGTHIIHTFTFARGDLWRRINQTSKNRLLGMTTSILLPFKTAVHNVYQHGHLSTYTYSLSSTRTHSSYCGLNTSSSRRIIVTRTRCTEYTHVQTVLNSYSNSVYVCVRTKDIGWAYKLPIYVRYVRSVLRVYGGDELSAWTPRKLQAQCTL